MWFVSWTFDKKYYGLLDIRKKDWIFKIRPYIIELISELQKEIDFLDKYFKQNDKLITWTKKKGHILNDKVWVKRTQ